MDGRLDEAETIILENGGLDLPDLREGEVAISALYIFIQVEKARQNGIELSPDKVKVPFTLDLRMAK